MTEQQQYIWIPHDKKVFASVRHNSRVTVTPKKGLSLCETDLCKQGFRIPYTKQIYFGCIIFFCFLSPVSTLLWGNLLVCLRLCTTAWLSRIRLEIPSVMQSKIQDTLEKGTATMPVYKANTFHLLRPNGGKRFVWVCMSVKGWEGRTEKERE